MVKNNEDRCIFTIGHWHVCPTCYTEVKPYCDLYTEEGMRYECDKCGFIGYAADCNQKYHQPPKATPTYCGYPITILGK